MTYARRVDANHHEIVETLRGIGAYVVDCARVGKGFPDLIVCFRGRLLWCEVKDGAKARSRRALSADERVFHAEVARHGCPVRMIETVEDALALLDASASA